MKKNKLDHEGLTEQTKAGLLIIMMSNILLMSLLFGYYIKFSGVTYTAKELETSNYKVIDDNKLPRDYNAEQLFADMYYNVLDKLTKSVAFGNTWLDICTGSQINIDGEVYVRTCDKRFKTKADLKKYVMKFLTKDFTSELVDDTYLDRNGQLWIKPDTVEKDSSYISFSSYSIKKVLDNKIVYMVKSKYGDPNCDSSCEYTYKEHPFELTYENNAWKVSNMIMPY